jgi:hypothetical protein
MLLLVICGDDQRDGQEVFTVLIAEIIIGKSPVIVVVYAEKGHKELDDIYYVEQQRKSHAEVIEIHDKVAYRIQKSHSLFLLI